MGRVRAVHGSGMGRVATIFAVMVAVIMTVAACGSSEPVTTTTDTIGTNQMPDDRKVTGNEYVTGGGSSPYDCPADLEALTFTKGSHHQARLGDDITLKATFDHKKVTLTWTGGEVKPLGIIVGGSTGRVGTDLLESEVASERMTFDASSLGVYVPGDVTEVTVCAEYS